MIPSDTNIDLPTLFKAIEFYKSRGYEMISAPMCVTKKAIMETLPDNRFPKEHMDGLYYVGSAEQSMYQIILESSKNTRFSGSYMMLTPCQRDEDPDETHFEIFLKLELVSFDNKDILTDVFDFYLKQYVLMCDLERNGRTLRDVEIVKTKTGSDITINGVEVGSFGKHTLNKNEMKFGTGLALPRYTQAIWKKQ